ncbi:MAG: hypothetical protein A2061_02160 [Gallionellales bacterium GWA2_59_43]|nr:MAG: hypothetical protein A2061_02160 [Gallionellales bacterium GWA2_59_43]
MENKPFPIRLERVMFTRSVVIAVPEHEPKDNDVARPGPENRIDITKVDDATNTYQAVMRTVINADKNKDDPYLIDMECIGLFHVDPDLEQDEAIRGVTITGHSVLYGAIREAVAWITGRQPYGQLMLGLSVLKPSNPPAE